VPVTADDFLWEATGHAAATTSIVVTHPDVGGTTAGSTVLVFTYSASVINTTAPSPWVRDYSGVGVSNMFAFRLDEAGAGETSWTFTRSTSGNTAWYMVEMSNLAVESLDVVSVGAGGTTSNGATRSTGTTALNAGSSTVAFAVFGCTKAASGDTQSWSGYTNSLAERADFSPAGVAGGQIAVASKLIDGWGTVESTATFATSVASATTGAFMILYRARDASINAPLAFHTGFEWGTYGGMGSAGTNPLGSAGGVGGTGTVGTNCRVIAAAAKNGVYGLEVDNSASNLFVYMPVLNASTMVATGYVQPVSGSGTVVAANFTMTGQNLFLNYDVATEKFGLQWSSGSTVWQTGTTPFGTYPGVQIRAKFNGAVWHADWWIETGTGDGFQTSPTDRTGASAATSVTANLGAANSQTAKFYYDDWTISRHYGAWPFGLHKVELLVPETTGATISGTSSNFQRFTSNGTLANVSGTEGALLDDVPPTVSASSDGVVQVAVAASDYINLPMATYTLAQTEIIAGVRFLASEWGGAGTGTGTLGWRGHDGLTETTFQAASASYDADSLTSVSATYPRWVSAMWSGGVNGAWDQAKLNAAAVRMGFSTDATPDMGASAVYLEVAVVTARTFVKYRLIDGEDPLDYQAAVLEYINPYNSGVRAYDIDNQDATRSVRFTYTIGGSETEVIVGPSTLTPVTVNEDAYGNVEATSFAWVV
jgi:hypothetical protein